MSDLSQLGKLIAAIGIGIAILGGVLYLAGRVPFLGRLPGDIVYRRDNVTIYFPIVTMLLLSLILTIVLNLIFRR